MIFKTRDRARNASNARNSFVTKRAETKLNALTDYFKLASGEHWVKAQSNVLRRKLFFSGFSYMDSLELVYNWENRFLSVNYNLQMISVLPTNVQQFEETGNCFFELECTASALKGTKSFSWNCNLWNESEEKLNAYIERLSNHFILERLNALDIMIMEIRHKKGQDHWSISCESIIGSATWMLIPPVFSAITPKLEECIKFLELYELLGDALVNNRA